MKKNYEQQVNSCLHENDALKEGLDCACEAVASMQPDELSWSPLAVYHSQVCIETILTWVN